jgi:hypothetical protein
MSPMSFVSVGKISPISFVSVGKFSPISFVSMRKFSPMSFVSVGKFSPISFVSVRKFSPIIMSFVPGGKFSPMTLVASTMGAMLMEIGSLFGLIGFVDVCDHVTEFGKEKKRKTSRDTEGLFLLISLHEPPLCKCPGSEASCSRRSLCLSSHMSVRGAIP